MPPGSPGVMRMREMLFASLFTLSRFWLVRLLLAAIEPVLDVSFFAHLAQPAFVLFVGLAVLDCGARALAARLAGDVARTALDYARDVPAEGGAEPRTHFARLERVDFFL